MEQLFHNLISNAFKFTKEDTAPEISITCRNLDREEVNNRRTLSKENTYVEILIKDNGIGFPPEFADQIFIIFQRLNDKKLYPGTGIGLALCSKIVANHGGEIYATAKENEGAEFYVILPVKSLKKGAGKIDAQIRASTLLNLNQYFFKRVNMIF